VPDTVSSQSLVDKECHQPCGLPLETYGTPTGTAWHI